ncbi:MAG: hypothetical protein IFNCLDLE_00937 [Ignavibacteriaceae bacterium]|nr:hypothetical protein [Ignavibacteriaceae bacterium]
MSYLNKIKQLLSDHIFLKYLIINIIFFLGLFGLLLGRLILKESNPFFYADF